MRNEISRPNQSSSNENSESSILVPADYRFDSELNEQKLVRKAVKGKMTVFDVGAHLGEYTKLFSLLVGSKGRVYAFEPTPGSSKELACSLQELNCSNVTLIGKAVYSENRKVVINEFPEKYSAWNSIGRPRMVDPEDKYRLVTIVNSVEVEAVTLDSFCQRHNISRIDYLKIDVEGAEIEALRGASGLLECRAVRYLQFEISEKMLQGLNTDARVVFDFLKSKGYECHRIDRDGIVGDIVTDSNSFYENYIAYPSKTVADKLNIGCGLELGVIIYGHTRPTLLRNNLESLRRQGMTANVHVWLDGDAGRAALKGPAEQCRELVNREFPWAILTTTNGNIGIEKLMIDGLSYMSERYDKIVVLEDDCFPTASAIAEFDKALNEIKDRPDVYSVYGHHFLTASEGELITRFQGWGWATTREKLLSILPEIKKCFTMTESDYLAWVRRNLTPEVVKRLDVTPGRNCIPVIASHFCWDGCTCLLTAMRGLSHKKTAKRVIYNCGLGDDSMHFAVIDRYLQPPFNMIHPKNAWDYYDDSVERPTHKNIRLQTAPSLPVTIANEKQSSQPAQMVVDGILFTDIKRTKYQNNSVGFSDNYIIKVEHEKHPRKLRCLSEEIEIVKFLNSKGCVSCPEIISEGTLKSGERYYIQQRISNDRPFNTADMIFSMLEQKNLGVCQGDFRKDNLLFNSNGVCYIIDYDQALFDERFKSMGNVEYIEWYARYMEERWREYNLTDFYKWGGYNKEQIYGLFNKSGSFNLAGTTIFKEQITTNTRSGIYHSLRTGKLYVEGCRDLNPRLKVLNSIEFRKGERVLDVGCNMGLLGHYLHDRGCRVTGVDMDPKIVVGAKMVANILGKDITFAHHDMDEKRITEDYDSICLFSVIHHVKKFDEVTTNIAQRCNRIILEVALKENGSKPVGGKWTKTSGWEFTTVEQLVHCLEGVFSGFKLHSYCGSVDRDRHIMTLVKQSANVDVSGRDIFPAKDGASSAGYHVVEQKPALVNSSKSQYLVSAIVSTYNAERFIRGCMEDLENQTIADKLEIIVVDSGSQQNEAAIVREFQQRYNNIKYIRTERETIYGAWNRGIKAASGKYITNANTDDRHYRDSLEKLAVALEQNPRKVIAYGSQHITSTIDGEITGERRSKQGGHLEMLSGRFWLESQPMWRRDLHNTVGYFDEQFFCSGDYEFWIRATQQFEMLYVDIFTGKRLMNDSVVSLADKYIQSFENRLIPQCYDYAIRTCEPIGKQGLSGDARMANWPEMKVWKRRVAAKLTGRRWQPCDEIIDVKDMRAGHKPKLSVVVIETEATGWQCVRSLAAQNNQDFELIIIAYDSSPAQSDLSAFTGRICIVRLKDDIGPSFARNIGIAQTKGDFIAYLDSDMRATPGWVDAVLRQFANPQVMAARGQIVGNNDSQQAAVTESYATFCENADNSAFRKSVLLEVKGFDEDMFAHEGAELSYRIYESANNTLDVIRFEPGMAVGLDVVSSESQQIIRENRNSRMNLLLRRKHKGIVGYIEFHRSQNPFIRRQSDKDYIKIGSVVDFLQQNHPDMALKWMEEEAALNPDSVACRYILGKLYLLQERYDDARSLFENILGPVEGVLVNGCARPSDSDKDLLSQIAYYYISISTGLAQCYIKQGHCDKVRQVYGNILNKPYLTIPQEQRADIIDVLRKLDKTSPVPVVEQSKSNGFKSDDGTGNGYLVSAIVSTYNAEKFLRGCLADLENQTIADKLEIIVVNSGSEQDEEAVVREFQKRYNNIVYIKTDKREGLYTAWNRAIKVASGQFLTSANTDDRHRKDALEVMAGVLLVSPDFALAYGDQIVTDTLNPTYENHHVIEMAKRPEFSRERLLFGCCVGSQPIWRKSLHDEFGYFDETLTCAADWDFWLKIAGKYKFKHIPEFLGLYYRNENGIEHGQKIHSLYERYAVGRRYGNPYISVIPLYQNSRKPLVSIVMPAYNAADYIVRAIESVLIQNYRNFELIVVDDGSTDRTADIVRDFKNEQIKYFFKENGGVASARNFGLQKAGGTFIVMLDSDDMMTPDYIAGHLREFERYPEMDMVYCDDLLINEQDKPIRVINRPEYSDPKSFISDMFRCGFPVVHFKTCIRKSVFDKLGLYDQRLIVGEDYDMMRRFVKQGLKMRHLPAALYLRRLTTTSSLSRNFNAEKAKSHFDVVRRFTETFTPEQLFPDVQWDKLPAEQKSLLAKCKTAIVYLGIGEQYVISNTPDYAETAFEMASAQLEDCCKIEPANQQVRNLREKCRSIRARRLSSGRRLEVLSPRSVV